MCASGLVVSALTMDLQMDGSTSPMVKHDFLSEPVSFCQLSGM